LKHLNLGAWYLPLTAFCFAAMSNGVNLTDGLDGLAAGCSAAAFAGMAIAALNIYPGK
jgi:phospho-N-acetylmuramoyl-pentapeptide-transferase